MKKLLLSVVILLFTTIWLSLDNNSNEVSKEVSANNVVEHVDNADLMTFN